MICRVGPCVALKTCEPMPLPVENEMSGAGPAVVDRRASLAPRLRWPHAQTMMLYGIVGLLFALLWGVVIWFSAQQRLRLLDENQRELEQLRYAVASHTEALLRSAESDLKVIDQWLQANPRIDPLHDAAFLALVAQMRQASDGLIDPRVVTTQGMLHYLPDTPGFVSTSVSDRDYYRAAINDPERRIHIADPVLSRITGKWGIPISLRLARPVGGIEVVFAAIELDRLMAFHEQFRAKPAGSVVMVRMDGVVLSRTPYLPDLVGKNVGGAASFRQVFDRTSATVTAPSSLTDRVPRFVSYQPVTGYPVIVAVTRGIDDTMQTYYQRRRVVFTLVSLASLIGVVATWRLAASQRALRKAQAAQRVLTSVFDATSDFVAQMDAEGRLVYLNPAGRRLVGIAPDEPVQGRSALTYMPAWMEKMRREEILPTVHAKGVWTGEAVVLNAQGQEVPISHMVIAHRGEDGQVAHYSAVMRDITNLKLAEQSLRQSERRLRSITDRIPIRVSYIDQEQRYRFLNQAYESAFRWPREALYGRTVREVLGEGAYSQVAPYIERALRGEALGFDSELTNQEGYRCYRATYIPQFSDDGQTVLGVVAMIQDTTVQKLEERRLIQLSQLDSLTGLLNRAGFEKRRREAMKKTRHEHGLMALMIVDIDGFKHVNDTLGHEAGDMLLRGIAGRLLKTLRASDVVARPGGDEFAVMLEGLSGDSDASAIAQNMVEAMRAPFVLEDRVVSISVSIGVAMYRGQPQITEQVLTRKADELLYEVKRLGRDGYRMGDAIAG